MGSCEECFDRVVKAELAEHNPAHLASMAKCGSEFLLPHYQVNFWPAMGNNADPDPNFHFESDPDPDPTPSFTHVGNQVPVPWLSLYYLSRQRQIVQWSIRVTNYSLWQKHWSNDDFSIGCCNFQTCQSILEKVIEGSQPQLGSQDVFFCFVDQYYRWNW